jgi:hypothetical protein
LVRKQQLLTTTTNPDVDRLPEFLHFFCNERSSYKNFSDTFEIYIGGENIEITNRENVILGNENPFGPTFDASIVYGPVFGQMYYMVCDLKLNNLKKNKG